MEAWKTAWLGYEAMPPSAFPRALLEPMLTIADAWLLSNRGVRLLVEEWVPRAKAYEVMTGLLTTGFCRRNDQKRRVEPIPVVVQMLYETPPPSSVQDLRRQMRMAFAAAFRQWVLAYRQLGDDLVVAP